jgi:hypothetical protein
MRIFALGLALTLGLTGCSIQKLAINSLAGALAESSDVYASDEDPDLVRDALPFALKTMESLLAKVPDNPQLLLGACSGFTQYSYAFVDTEAFLVEDDDFREARRLKERALKLYLRARGYCFEALRLKDPDLLAALRQDPVAGAERLGAEDADLLFWTAASWGSAIALALDQPEFVADVPVPRALLERLEVLAPEYGDGTLAEALLVLATLPETLGGSQEAARVYFARALELSQGQSVSAHVTLAQGVMVPSQDRKEFTALLHKALAIDVDAPGARKNRLANVIAQRRAAELLRRVDEYFLEDLETAEEPP